jgi:hypothetical protein
MTYYPYTITAIAINTTAGSNIVAGAMVSILNAIGNPQAMFDNAAGSNGSSGKTTDARGQVTIYVPLGTYDLSVNGTANGKIIVSPPIVNATEVVTFAELQTISPVGSGRKFVCQERANAEYTVQPSGYVALAGDVTFANGLVGKLKDIEDIRSYGLIGITDCSAVIQLALNSGRSNDYRFYGNFTVDIPVPINGINNLSLNCKGAYFDCSNMFGADVSNEPDSLFKPTGTIALTTSLSANATINTSQLTLTSVVGIQAGMPLILRSDEHWYTETVSIGKCYVGEVRSVSGSVVTMQEPLPFSFTVSGFTTTVEVITPIENFSIKGGIYYGGNYRRNLANGVGIGFVYAYAYKNVSLKPEYVNGFENTAIRAEKGLNLRVAGFDIQGHLPSFGTVTEGVNSGFYGVFPVDSRNVYIDKVTGYRCRHLQDASRTYNLNVTDTTGVNCHRPALGCHSGTHDGTYTNCNAYGGFGGLQWRGFHLYVNGGTYDCPKNSSNGIYDVIGGANDIPSIKEIKPNRVLAERNAVNISGKFSHCSVTGDFKNTDSVYSCVDFSGNYLGYTNVSAKIEQAGSSGIALKQSSNSVVELGVFKVQNSYISSDTNLIRMFAPTNTGTVWISNNVFDSSAATFDININSAQNFERTADNFRPDGTAATRN